MTSAVKNPSARAAGIVSERNADYGAPRTNMQRIADFWNVALRDKLAPGMEITAADVAQLNRLQKESRLVQTPQHADSLVDICGYADVQHQCVVPDYALGVDMAAPGGDKKEFHRGHPSWLRDAAEVKPPLQATIGSKVKLFDDPTVWVIRSKVSGGGFIANPESGGFDSKVIGHHDIAEVLP